MKDYWEKIAKKINEFSKPNDLLKCAEIYHVDKISTCELCGYEGISWINVLENLRTNQRLKIGSRCVGQYHMVSLKIDKPVQITYPDKFKKSAILINKNYPGAVEIEAPLGKQDLSLDEYEFDWEGRAPEGLGDDEIDWDSLDYE
jgi:hypothetical protein